MENVLDHTVLASVIAEPEEKPSPMLDTLALSVCQFEDSDKSLYRIYFNAKEYELLEAGTAAEAIQKASQKPYKVLRESMDNYSSIPRKKLRETVEGVVVYTDVGLTTADKKRVTFDVSSYQVSPTSFDEIGLGGLAKKELEQEPEDAPAPKAHPAPEPEAPVEKIKAAQHEAEETADEGELSPEEVAELLGESQ